MASHFHDWHRYKGTVHGHALYWRVLLRRAVYGHAPRYNSFCGASLTAAEQSAYEALHPEIRIYPFRNKSTVHGLFLNWVKSPSFTVTSDAADRVGKQIYYDDPVTGIETKLNKIADDADRISIALAGRMTGAWLGGAMRGFTVDHGAPGRIYQINLSAPMMADAASGSLAARPLTPMYSNYRVVRQRGIGQGIFLSNRYRDYFADEGGAVMGGYLPKENATYKIFLQQSDAGDRIYKQLKLFDKSRAYNGTRNARAFLGGFRIGAMPAHHGEIAVDATGTAPSPAAYLGPAFIGFHCFAISDAADRIKMIVDVGRMAARISDKIGISITNHQVIKASTAYKAGSVKAGQYVLRYI